MTRVQVYISSMIISVVFTATIIITITGFANFGIAQGQANNITSSSSLTRQQKDAICNPNNSESKLDFVNTTESKICGIPPTSTNTTVPTNTTPTTGKQSPSSLYKQGYAKGIADSKLVQVTIPPIGAMMSPDYVDCDSDIDPLANNQDYCSGYQHGYADTFNSALPRK